ncbi:PD40 domain-containing protein [Candidatus Nitrososphaera evergladensis]|nr:PD40 domain-containing protein [Candidatus Nitrososphaera evergladensis]
MTGTDLPISADLQRPQNAYAATAGTGSSSSSSASSSKSASASASATADANGRIAFGVFYGAGNIVCGGAIFIMNPDGTNPKRVPNADGCGSSPSFSPDGKRLVFDKWSTGTSGFLGGSEIDAVNLDGTDPVWFSVTNRTVWWMYDYSPSFSPDGTKIVFSSWKIDDDGHRHIYVMNSNGTVEGAVRLTNNNTADDDSPVYSPDGKKIVFTRAGDIYSMNADDGGDLTNLTNNGADANNISPTFSPNGKKIAFASDRDDEHRHDPFGSVTNNWNIYVMNASDGSNQTRLTSNPARDDGPTWSPDGAKIAFSSWRDHHGWHSEIYVMNAADGSGQKRITNFDTLPGGGDSFGPPSWGPSAGTRILSDDHDAAVVVADSLSCLALSAQQETKTTMATSATATNTTAALPPPSSAAVAWDPATSTCTINNGVTLAISKSGFLAIAPTVTLKVSMLAVLQNNGTIISSGAVKNDGTIDNLGVINSAGAIENYGLLKNSGTLSNSNTIDNYGTIDNIKGKSGRFVNSGYIIVHSTDAGGRITGSGSIVNSGYIAS